MCDDFDWGTEESSEPTLVYTDEKIEQFANNADELNKFLLLENSSDNLKLVLEKIQELKFTPLENIIESAIDNAGSDNKVIELLIDKQCPVSFTAIFNALNSRPILLYPLVSNASSDVKQLVIDRIPDILLQVIQKDCTDVDDVLRILIQEFKVNVNFISRDQNSQFEQTALQHTITFDYSKAFDTLIVNANDLKINLTTPKEPRPPLVLAFHNGRYKMACDLIIHHFADINQIVMNEMPNENGFSQLCALLYTLGYNFNFDEIRKKYTFVEEYDYADEDIESLVNMRGVCRFNTNVTKEWQLFEKWIYDRKEIKPLKIRAAEAVRQITSTKEEMNQLIQSLLFDDETKRALFLYHVNAKNEFTERRLCVGDVDFNGSEFGSEFGYGDDYDDYEGYDFESDDNYAGYDDHEDYDHDIYDNFL